MDTANQNDVDDEDPFKLAPRDKFLSFMACPICQIQDVSELNIVNVCILNNFHKCCATGHMVVFWCTGEVIKIKVLIHQKTKFPM